MTTSVRQQRRRQAPAPEQPPAIVSGRYLSMSFHRDRRTGEVAFKLAFGKIGETGRAKSKPRKRASSQGKVPRPSARLQRRDAKATTGTPKRSRQAKVNEAMRAVGRLATAPARLLKRAWTAVRRRVPGQKLDPRGRTEVKKFTLIGWAGLAPGLASLATTLATGNPLLGFAAQTMAQAANSPVQGYLSAIVERKLGNKKGQSLDMEQNHEIKALKSGMKSLANELRSENAELKQQVADLKRQLDEQKTGRGSSTRAQSGKTAGTPTPKKADAKADQKKSAADKSERTAGSGRSAATGSKGKQTGRETKGSAKSGNGRTSNTRSKDSGTRSKNRQPRSR